MCRTSGIIYFFVFTIIDNLWLAVFCYARTNQELRMFFLTIGPKQTKINRQKKTVQIVKEELLDSIIEREDQDDLDMGEVVKNTNVAQEAITLINRYEGTLKSKNIRIINIVGNQEFLLKRFKEEMDFWILLGA